MNVQAEKFISKMKSLACRADYIINISAESYIWTCITEEWSVTELVNNYGLPLHQSEVVFLHYPSRASFEDDIEIMLNEFSEATRQGIINFFGKSAYEYERDKDIDENVWIQNERDCM